MVDFIGCIHALFDLNVSQVVLLVLDISKLAGLLVVSFGVCFANKMLWLLACIDVIMTISA